MATLSLPQDRAPHLPSVAPRFVHTEQTKRKISAAVTRRAAKRHERLQHFVLALRQRKSASTTASTSSSAEEEEEEHAEDGDHYDGHDLPKKKPRRLSVESRAKISAALKGRRKSLAHREALRARFEGDRNPMFGRKLSKESRAKISAAMAGRAARKKEGKAVRKKEVSEDAIHDLREKAVKSRLLAKDNANSLPKRRTRERLLLDQAEVEEIDQLLSRVARLDKPPDNVARTLESNRRMRESNGEVEEDPACGRCKATGFVACPECVGAFGVASAKCEGCFGAGAVFCKTCQGVGQLTEGGVC